MQIFAEAFTDKSIGFLSIMFLFLELGWSIYFQFIGLYMAQRFGYSVNQLGLFMACVGLGFAVAFLWVIHQAVKLLSYTRIVLYSVLITTLIIFVTLPVHHSYWVWPLGFLVALFMALAYSTTITLYSNLAGEERQGWIMGISNAVIGVAGAASALGASFLQNWNLHAPLFTAGILMTITTLLMYLYQRTAQAKNAD